MNDIVSFDFDGTLSREDVQQYCRWLLNNGVDVWVITSRYDELHKHLYPGHPTNSDLYQTIDKLGIPRYKVVFMNFQPKADYLAGTNLCWHLDDDLSEVTGINEQTEIAGILVTTTNWQNECNKRLLTLQSQSK